MDEKEGRFRPIFTSQTRPIYAPLTLLIQQHFQYDEHFVIV